MSQVLSFPASEAYIRVAKENAWCSELSVPAEDAVAELTELVKKQILANSRLGGLIQRNMGGMIVGSLLGD